MRNNYVESKIFITRKEIVQILKIAIIPVKEHVVHFEFLTGECGCHIVFFTPLININNFPLAFLISGLIFICRSIT